jgi:DNA-binding transcriptional LysR family regulator
MHFSLRQIAVFDAVARLGSVSRAAEEVALTQSAASMALKELEENLGAQLFHRHGRRLLLNENGRRLRPKAHSLMLLASEISQPQTGDLEGMLRIGATPTIGDYLLPECSAAFINRHPKVQMEIISGAVSDIAERVEAMSVDLGVIDTTCNRNTLQIEPIADDHMVVFAAPTHPLAQRPKISIGELRSASWCVRTAPSGTRIILATLLGGAIHDIRFAATTYEGVRSAVVAGLGLGFASMRVIARQVAAGELVVIDADSSDLYRKFTLLAPKNVYHGTLPTAFADHLRGWFAREKTVVREMAKDTTLRSVPVQHRPQRRRAGV